MERFFIQSIIGESNSYSRIFRMGDGINTLRNIAVGSVFNS
jgi:hypothetical protein